LSHTSGSHSLYRWTNPAKQDEAFYVEAIYKSDQNLYQLGSGLAVWHIDPAGNNSDEWHPYVQMEHADGRRDLQGLLRYGAEQLRFPWHQFALVERRWLELRHRQHQRCCADDWVRPG